MPLLNHWADVEYAVEYEVAGLDDPEHAQERGLKFSATGSCGRITDGVAFEHPSIRGGWVISFWSLADMYQRARVARGLSESA